ncbi:GNAT family N-acetyltransferase [Opitutia bacterium ISCC 51]|nr:GNAT family N-acetyltransferase [Opitutae bacterium ISCC 51]QXD29731.1 GNAT family N-acetyltransferase [Opitutae bacterium ISCC 52]
MGYLIARPYWGQGLITEVLQHWTDWALNQPEIYRISALCDIDNPASGRVMEKAGLSLEGTFKRYGIHPNIGDELVISIVMPRPADKMRTEALQPDSFLKS